jgi:hypothetical protein
MVNAEECGRKRAWPVLIPAFAVWAWRNQDNQFLPGLDLRNRCCSHETVARPNLRVGVEMTTLKIHILVVGTILPLYMVCLAPCHYSARVRGGEENCFKQWRTVLFICLLLWNPKVHHVCIKLRLSTVSWTSSIHFTSSPAYLLLISILSTFYVWIFQVFSLFEVFEPKCNMHFFPHACCMPRPSNSPLFNHPNGIGFEVSRTVRIHIVVFWVVTSCSLLYGTYHGVTTQNTVVWTLRMF